jgi:branched-chain amino acid transport system substrate-binding protein
MDDAYDPARTVSNVRTLAEQDGIFALSGVLGTSPNLAIADYVAGERIPNLLTNTGTDEIMKQEGEFWTMGGLVQYDFEAKALADHIIAELPDAKVALLYQNDGFGKNMLANFEKHFEGTGVSLVATQSYEQSGGSADSQVVNLAKSGADVFISYATGTFMTQAIKKAHEVGWKPLTIVSSGTNHAEHVMKPAGPGAVGAMSITWLKDVTDPSWADDPGMQNWMAFAEKHTGDFEAVDSVAASAYNSAQILQAVLENMDGCTREDMLEAAQSLDSVETDLFLPGVTSSTTEDYPYFVTSLQLIEFDGQAWHGVGDVLTRE